MSREYKAKGKGRMLIKTRLHKALGQNHQPFKSMKCEACLQLNQKHVWYERTAQTHTVVVVLQLLKKQAKSKCSVTSFMVKCIMLRAEMI